jgi:hypothetical protein
MPRPRPRRPTRAKANEPRDVVVETYVRCQQLIDLHSDLLSGKERRLLEVVTHAFQTKTRVTKSDLDAAFGVLGSFTPTARRNVSREVSQRREALS